ncbi:MAG: penicillin acylase family protein [Xanthomonadales bacterium]|nr:penicillin acylase family protein [Xanthomonadales bacterium]
MKRIFVRSLTVLVVLLLGATAYLAWTVNQADKALPQWDGIVSAAGLGASVEITRDRYGNPFITAASEADLYFAQGFVHAQDRFWQMALARQVTSGRLSEWLGSLSVRGDRLQRMMGWRHVATRAFEALPEQDRYLLQAYADGVNAWLDSPAYVRPPEMVILHVHPEPWQPADAFMVGYSLHDGLANYGSEVQRTFLHNEGAKPGAYEVFDTNHLPAPPIVSGVSGQAPPARQQPTAAFKQRAFSNNWTLSGAHTASGLPLMASDPQLPVSVPNVWQLQHHTLAGRRMAGATLPGLPGIAVGHNGRVAWGITASYLDEIDFTQLEISEEDPNIYRRGPDGEWQAFEQRTETIRVRFGTDLEDVVRSTPTGVALPAGRPSALLVPGENLTVEGRWAALEFPDGMATSFIHLNRANSVAEGIAALESLHALAMNFSLADDQGNIGYTLAARIPIRPQAHATRIGLAPDDANDWQGTAPNPSIINPPSGRIVSANQVIIGDEYDHYLTDVWAAPYRAWRIHELLDQRERHDPESFRVMQMDTLSPVARELTPLLLEAEPSDDVSRNMLAVLEDWDYRFSLDSAGPTVWLAWVEALRMQMVQDEVGVLAPYWYAMLYTPLTRALSGEKLQWCDDVTTGALEDCAALLKTSLSLAGKVLEERFGADPSQWRWGDHARFVMPHAGFSGLPVLGNRFSRLAAIPGGPESLFINSLMSNGLTPPYQTVFNPSFQAIYDLSDLDGSLFMMSGGASGHAGSPHYNDMTELWLAGERITLQPDSARSENVLVLKPGGG